MAQPSAVRLRWTQRCVRGAGASSGCYIDVARAPRAPSPARIAAAERPTVHTDQHAHGRDSTRPAPGIFTDTPEHQSVGASGSAYEKLAAARGLRAQVSVVRRSGYVSEELDDKSVPRSTERDAELALRRIPGTDHLPESAGLSPNGKGRTAVSSGQARSEAAAAAACHGVTEAPGANIAAREPLVGNQSNGGDHRPPVR